VVSAGLLNVDDLSVTLGRAHVVRGVTCAAEAGEWVAVIGANGAGKTTFLRAVAQLQHYGGRVRVGEHELRALSRRRRAQLIAYVPQDPEFPADMTVGDYVLLGRTPHLGYFGIESAGDRRHCADLLGRLALGELGGRRLSTLSGGERQRLVLARSLAQDAPVLLLDEPTSALDLGRRVEALELVDELRRERGLVVVSAMHDLTLAARFADRLVLLSAGSVVADGAPAAVLEEQLLSRHFGGRVRVLVTDEGDIVVVPGHAVGAA
jgi:iron complex transport system ATP-binding protein